MRETSGVVQGTSEHGVLRVYCSGLRLAQTRKDYFEAGRETLQRLVREHCPSGGNALIAGAADSRLFGLVAQTVAGLPSAITVVDRCQTPLLVCRRYAERHGLAVATIEADIAQALPGGSYDMALAHLTLMFVPVAAQAGRAAHPIAVVVAPVHPTGVVAAAQ